MCAHNHLVEFYETEAFLVSTVADFVVSALNYHDSAIVIATAEHRAAFAQAIHAQGVDIDAAEREGRYRTLDAREALGTLMVDGTLDPDRFHHIVGTLIDDMAEDARHVKIYGEMVALLLADGDVDSTIALEDLWNDLATDRDFSLLCAYPLREFDAGSSATFKKVCEQHSTVIPAEDYSLAADMDAQQRLVAELQQENSALRAELRRRRSGAATQARLFSRRH